LSNYGRKISPFIYKGLVLAKEEYKRNKNARKIISNLKKYYKINNVKQVDYIEIINPKDMSHPKEATRGTYILVAVKIGKIRLIDNLKF